MESGNHGKMAVMAAAMTLLTACGEGNNMTTAQGASQDECAQGCHDYMEDEEASCDGNCHVAEQTDTGSDTGDVEELVRQHHENLSTYSHVSK